MMPMTHYFLFGLGESQVQWGNSPGSSAFRGQHSPEDLQGTGPRQNAQFNIDWLKTNTSDPTSTFPLTKKTHPQPIWFF